MMIMAKRHDSDVSDDQVKEQQDPGEDEKPGSNSHPIEEHDQHIESMKSSASAADTGELLTLIPATCSEEIVASSPNREDGVEIVAAEQFEIIPEILGKQECEDDHVATDISVASCQVDATTALRSNSPQALLEKEPIAVIEAAHDHCSSIEGKNSSSEKVDSGLKCLTDMLDAISKFGDVTVTGSSPEEVQSALSAALCSVECFADWRWPATVNHAMNADVSKLLLSSAMPHFSQELVMKYGLPGNGARKVNEATDAVYAATILSSRSEGHGLCEPFLQSVDVQDEGYCTEAAKEDLLPPDVVIEHVGDQLPSNTERKVYAYGEQAVEEDLSAWVDRSMRSL